MFQSKSFDYNHYKKCLAVSKMQAMPRSSIRALYDFLVCHFYFRSKFQLSQSRKVIELEVAKYSSQWWRLFLQNLPILRILRAAHFFVHCYNTCVRYPTARKLRFLRKLIVFVLSAFSLLYTKLLITRLKVCHSFGLFEEIVSIFPKNLFSA